MQGVIEGQLNALKEEKKIVQIKDKGADSCDETDSDAEAKGGRWNPYTEFLQNIEDEDSEDEEVCFKTSHQSQFERESSSQCQVVLASRPSALIH